MAAVIPVERFLEYPRDIVPQTTGWSCGPGAAEIVLSGLGLKISEQQLIKDIGTTTNGTDFVGLIVDRALNRYDPAGKWQAVYTEKDPMTAAQKNALWDHLTYSIGVNGRGLVTNLVVPPWNRPQVVPPSTINFNYPNAWTWHYTAIMAYRSKPDRACWMADSGFSPGGGWISFDWLATAIPPKGYAWSSATDIAPPPVEPPEPPPSDSQLDVIFREVTQRLPGRTVDDELRDVILDPRRADTLLGHSVNAAGLGRVNLEILRRIADHLGVQIGDIS